MCKLEQSTHNCWRFFDHSCTFLCIHAEQIKSSALVTLTKKPQAEKMHLSLFFPHPHGLLNYLFWKSELRRKLHVEQMHSQNTVKERALKREVGCYLCDLRTSTHTVRDFKQNYPKIQLWEKVSQSPHLSKGLKDSFFPSTASRYFSNSVVLCWWHVTKANLRSWNIVQELFISPGKFQVLFKFLCFRTKSFTETEQHCFRHKSYSSCKLGALCYLSL